MSDHAPSSPWTRAPYAIADEEPRVERLTGLPLFTVWAAAAIVPWWVIVTAYRLIS